MSKANEYCKNNKDKIIKQAKERYSNMSEEKKAKEENTKEIDITTHLKKKRRKEKSMKKANIIECLKTKKIKKENMQETGIMQ